MRVRVVVLLTLGGMMIFATGCGSFDVAERGVPTLTQPTALGSLPHLKVNLMTFADGRDPSLRKSQHGREVVGHVTSTLTRFLVDRDFTARRVIGVHVTEAFANEFRRNGHEVIPTEEPGVLRVRGVVKKYWVDGLQEAFGTDFSGSVIVEIQLHGGFGVGGELTKTFYGHFSKKMTSGSVWEFVADVLDEAMRSAVLSFANDRDVLKFLKEANPVGQ